VAPSEPSACVTAFDAALRVPSQLAARPHRPSGAGRHLPLAERTGTSIRSAISELSASPPTIISRRHPCDRPAAVPRTLSDPSRPARTARPTRSPPEDPLCAALGLPRSRSSRPPPHHGGTRTSEIGPQALSSRRYGHSARARCRWSGGQCVIGVTVQRSLRRRQAALPFQASSQVVPSGWSFGRSASAAKDS
jgi:hypothetical protein